MKFYELKKQAQLLIYMLNYEANNGSQPFSIAKNAHDVIDVYHITKSKKSLSSMLSTLAAKCYVDVDCQHRWWLTRVGQAEAEYWLSKCDNDASLPVVESSSSNSLTVCNSLQELVIKLAVIIVDIDKKTAEVEHVVDGLKSLSTKVQKAIDLTKAMHALS